MERWPHQKRINQEVAEHLDRGTEKVCVVSATGSGKSISLQDTILQCLARKKTCRVLVNRKLLFGQLKDLFDSHGIRYSVIASGYPKRDSDGVDAQLCMLQTLARRSFKPMDVLIIDERHVNCRGNITKIEEDHRQVIGFTATPVEIGHHELVHGASNSEGRSCGALLPADIFAPIEPELKWIGKVKTGEYVIDNKLIELWNMRIVGIVFDEWDRLNGDHRPTVLFASSVASSLWWAQEADKRYGPGTAAHIDGSKIWYEGSFQNTTSHEARGDIFENMRKGSPQMICSRFVLREGWNFPELYMAIAATPFGSIQTYVQSIGRLLRNHPTLDRTVFLDCGGCWHKFGSINQDWNWVSYLPARAYHSQLADKFREGLKSEPICCPNCHGVRSQGRKCPYCGFEYNHSVRHVVQRNGRIVKRTGDIYRPRKRKQFANTAKLWERMYWRSIRAKRTFFAAEALFNYEYGYWPSRNLPFMPKDSLLMYAKVNDVPVRELISVNQGE